MALFPVNVDFTQKDQKALRLRLQGLIRSVFPKWTEFNIANFGNIVIESFAFTGGVMTFYQDNQARELFWPTVTQRANAIRHGRLINFSLSSAQPSTTTERFSLPSTALVGVDIPEGSRVRTPNGISFRTTIVGRIEVGSTFDDVAVEQAQKITGETFSSSGGPNQRFITQQSPVIDGTLEVVALDGTYLEVASFLDPDPVTGTTIGSASRVFVVLGDPFNRAIILFGNGKTGKIPEGVITVDYKIGGGTDGNVDADQIIVLEDTLRDDTSAIASVSVTNPTASAGGVDRVSVLAARALGPQSLRVLERSVTKEDFEINALSVPGVARAAMVTSNEDSAVQENEGFLLIVAKGQKLTSGRIAAAIPSSTTLDQVNTKVTVEKPQTLTFVVNTAAATLRAINISARVFLAQGVVPATVGQSVRDAIDDFFAAQLADGTANPDIDFGANIKQADGTTISEIAWSDVFNAIRDTTGVRKVDEGPQGLLLNLLRSSVTLSPRDFPIVGTVALVDADTGLAI
jgi:hypothetical protein